MSSPSPATDVAGALLSELAALGVTDIVLSPGSRSQALALVAAQLDREEKLSLHVRIDERSAAFLALGLARESGRPVAVACTSGTAVANLVPAAREAYHSGVPLILLTADRPPELHGVGSNQTTEQNAVFGGLLRFQGEIPTPDAMSDIAQTRALAQNAVFASLGAGQRWGEHPAGPVQINLPFREPLSGTLDPRILADAGRDLRVPEEAEAVIAEIDVSRPTVLIAGADAGEEAEEIARLGGIPLIAEIVSGARFGRETVHGYRELLRDPALGGRIATVIVAGHPTLSREVAALLLREDIRVVAFQGPGEAPARHAEIVDAVHFTGEAPARWLADWLDASRARRVDLSVAAPDGAALMSQDPRARLGAIRNEVAAARAPLDREMLVDAVWRASWPHDRLVFGSSRIVRVADRVLGGKKVRVHANRGLAGIDGTIATALGIAIVSQREGAPGVTRLLLGDLAFLHDVGSLLPARGEKEPRIQIIVGNDGGGTIFSELEVAGTAPEIDFARVFLTPQSVRIEHLALAYGWEYTRATTRAALDQALTRTTGGMQIIEVPLS